MGRRAPGWRWLFRVATPMIRAALAFVVSTRVGGTASFANGLIVMATYKRTVPLEGNAPKYRWRVRACRVCSWHELPEMYSDSYIWKMLQRGVIVDAERVNGA